MSAVNASEWTLDAIPVLTDNYVWTLDDRVQAVIVDPGESAPVESWLRGRSLRLSAIMLTHHHPDHVGGVPALQAAWPDARVFAPRDDRIAFASERVGDGDQVRPAGGLEFSVLSIPGHTSSHVAFHGHGHVFCGDTLFSAGCGRMFEGTAAQMLESLDALLALPDPTNVCCGHEYTAANCRFALHVDPGNAHLTDHAARVERTRSEGRATVPTPLRLERRINPFLRIDSPAVRQALVRHRGLQPDASREEAFAALRSWKDVFGG
jgi:hydroxyacylglutathione hydrolase